MIMVLMAMIVALSIYGVKSEDETLGEASTAPITTKENDDGNSDDGNNDDDGDADEDNEN